MIHMIETVNGTVNNFVWGILMLLLLVGVIALSPVVMQITRTYVNRRIREKMRSPGSRHSRISRSCRRWDWTRIDFS